MKVFRGPKKSLVYFAVFSAGVVLLPKSTLAELVYEKVETEPTAVVAEPAPARVEDRSALRDAIRTSEKAKASANQEVEIGSGSLPYSGNTSIIQVQPQVQAAPTAVSGSSGEVEHMSRSELLRRERMREEMKNEDLLQERLESLRLRDEQRRTNEVLAPRNAPAQGSLAPEAYAPHGSAQNVQVEELEADQVVVVGSAVPERKTKAQSDQISTSQATLSRLEDGLEEEMTTVSVMPRAGVGNFTSTSGYDVRPRYALGVGLDIGVSERLGFELGYTYAEHGVRMNDSNGFYAAELARAQAYGGNVNFETLSMKQNIIDGGLKLYLLGRKSKFRPFFGGGGAYSKSFINYDQRILDNMGPTLAQTYGQDYEVSSFLGYLSTGMEVQVARSISIGAQFKYYGVLSSNESGSLNNYAFVPQNQYGYPSYGAQSYDPSQVDKSRAAGSLRSAFYTILGGVSFTF